ncbi:hypothetical protein GYMLUDRAFT_39477 [Collybiopsis luxurians FD-317 M1]|nr:hypothetical protein GYMLUDRAFT_39477 [Collybiopsis luxurians FD-317 M1]
MTGSSPPSALSNMTPSNPGTSEDSSPSNFKPKQSYSRYKVQSSDVLQEARTNVIDESTNQVLWFKERFLGDDEIIEHFIHSPTQSIHWTIHRPSRKGWYIRIRSPSFPPGVYIPLLPVNKRGKDLKGAMWEEGAIVDGSLGFWTRIGDGNSNSSAGNSTETTRSSTGSSIPVIHSYPPTPPPASTLVLSSASRPTSPSLDQTASISSSIPAAASSIALLDHQSSSSQSKKLSIPLSASATSTLAEFILSPTTSLSPTSSSPSPLGPSRDGLFSRALKAFKYYTASTEIISDGYSFTLSRVVVQAPPPYVASPAASGAILPMTMSPVPSPAGTSPSGPPISSSLSSSTYTPGSTSSGTGAPSVSSSNVSSPAPPLRKLRSSVPLLTFTDLTPAFNISGSISGLMTLDTRETEQLGVEESFWIAVGLVYVGFLEERGSYLASLGD